MFSFNAIEGDYKVRISSEAGWILDFPAEPCARCNAPPRGVQMRQFESNTRLSVSARPLTASRV
jgi:hypothetical protein